MDRMWLLVSKLVSKVHLRCRWPTTSPIPSAPIWLMTSNLQFGSSDGPFRHAKAVYIQSGTVHWISTCYWLPWVSGLRQLCNQISRYEIIRLQEITKGTPVDPNYVELSVWVQLNCIIGEEIAIETACVRAEMGNYDKQYTRGRLRRNEKGPSPVVSEWVAMCTQK